MSYPKVPPKANLGQQSRLTDDRKARLLKLQEREELKGLLISKFKKKYGGAEFISKEVENFIKSETLTEANLRKLDDKLAQKYEFKAPSSKAPSVAGSVRSQKSAASQGSRMSQQSAASRQAAPAQPRARQDD